MQGSAQPCVCGIGCLLLSQESRRGCDDATVHTAALVKVEAAFAARWPVAARAHRTKTNEDCLAALHAVDFSDDVLATDKVLLQVNDLDHVSHNGDEVGLA